MEALIIKNNVATSNKILKQIYELHGEGMPKIIVIGKRVKEVHNENEKLSIMNDFHVLPVAGHAGI